MCHGKRYLPSRAGRRSQATKRCLASPVLPIECFIPQKTELGRAAGDRIAYAAKGTGSSVAPLTDIRGAFDRLGDEIDKRIASGGMVKP